MNSGRLNNLKELWLWKGDRGKGKRKEKKEKKMRMKNLLISKRTFSVITEERGFSLRQRK